MAEKQRAPRNRTLTLDQNQQQLMLQRCLEWKKGMTAQELKDGVLFEDAFAVMPELPEGFVDLLIVDPPYNLTKQYGSRQFRRTNAQQYAEFTRSWIEAVKHTLKPNASIYVCCDWRSSMVIGQVLEEYFTLRNRITWQREKGRGAAANYKNSMEDIWFATVDSEKDYVFNTEAVRMRRRVIAPYRTDGQPKDWQETAEGNFRDTAPSNFWDDITVPYWSMPENTDHPTQKPEKLLAKLILASSNQGDMVLDPFGGVGSTAVTAKKLGRYFVTIEREAEYCALAQARLQRAEEDKTIQGYEDGVFWERNSKPSRK